ncbi:hypothetical protein H5P28_10665 [Ruficoccus amylovorans]|uniref:Uncharacterized protein n=1 Tax=Ruficoccus amylovorans TaxID=1804625 RepID=A0A842HE61_9BACT|nr:hypothetical protein [Ruficoccus amylovorans]MBC2594722.1 hypothetical protein [Ruficoccus amylovorans]
MGLEIVEFFMCIEETFDVEIDESTGVQLETPELVIEHLTNVLSASSASGLPCPHLRAFTLLRRYTKLVGAYNQPLKMETKLSNIFPQNTRRHWNALIASARGDRPRTRDNFLLFCKPWTVRRTIQNMTQSHLRKLLFPNESWDRSWIVFGVRNAIECVTGKTNYPMNGHFVKDIGMG